MSVTTHPRGHQTAKVSSNTIHKNNYQTLNNTSLQASSQPSTIKQAILSNFQDNKNGRPQDYQRIKQGGWHSHHNSNMEPQLSSQRVEQHDCWLLKYALLLEAIASAEIEKVDIQRLFYLCKDIETKEVPAGAVLKILLENYPNTPLEFVSHLMGIQNDQILRKLAALLLCLIGSESQDAQSLFCEAFNFTPLSGKVQINKIPGAVLQGVQSDPSLLAKLKIESHLLDQERLIWCYPQFQPQTDQHESAQRRTTTEDEDAFDFNDLETDERVNLDIVKFDKNFPDPLTHCIGFFAVSNKSSQEKLEERKQSKSKFNNLTIKDPSVNKGILKQFTTSTMSCNSPQTITDGFHHDFKMTPSDHHRKIIEKNNQLTITLLAIITSKTNPVSPESVNPSEVPPEILSNTQVMNNLQFSPQKLQASTLSKTPEKSVVSRGQCDSSRKQSEVKISNSKQESLSPSFISETNSKHTSKKTFLENYRQGRHNGASDLVVANGTSRTNSKTGYSKIAHNTDRGSPYKQFTVKKSEGPMALNSRFSTTNNNLSNSSTVSRNQGKNLTLKDTIKKSLKKNALRESGNEQTVSPKIDPPSSIKIPTTVKSNMKLNMCQTTKNAQTPALRSRAANAINGKSFVYSSFMAQKASFAGAQQNNRQQVPSNAPSVK